MAVPSDLSPNMLKLAQEKLVTDDLNVHYFSETALYLPFPDDIDAGLFLRHQHILERKKRSKN